MRNLRVLVSAGAMLATAGRMRDSDRDDIPDRYDGDKNGDGAPDRYQRRQ